jgi:hypothetical protein
VELAAGGAVAERAAEAGAERAVARAGGTVKWPADRNNSGGKLLARASVVVGFAKCAVGKKRKGRGLLYPPSL